MPADECIKKLIYVLQLLIFALLLGCHYIDIKDLLDIAKNIKNMKKYSSQLLKAREICHIKIELRT